MSFSIFLKSIFIGMGAILPGVSGGMLAIIFGLYHKLIDAISNLFKEPKKNMLFLINVGAGAGIGVISLATIQKGFLDSNKALTYIVLCALMVGTIPSLFKEANKNGFHKKYLIMLVIGVVIGFYLTTVENQSMDIHNVVFDFRTCVFLFISGFILAGSLLVPGISGSIILILLGVYDLFLGAVANFKDILFLFFNKSANSADIIKNIIVLIPIGAGVVAGALFFSRIMKLLMDKLYGWTFYLVLGFLIGSVPKFFSEGFGDNNPVLVVIIFILVLVFSVFLNLKFSNEN